MGNRKLALICLIAHATLLVASSRLHSPTRNEVAHVPAGLAYWEFGSYSLYSVNPPLWKMLATLPTLLLNPNVEHIILPGVPGDRPEWRDAAIFARDNAGDYFTLIWSARLAGIAWSLVGAWVVYIWAGALYSDRAGLLALNLWCFGPNVLAHGPLVTPDVPAAVAATAATFVFHRYLRAGSWQLAAAAGGLLGLAQLTKFTLLVLYPIWLLLFLVHALDRGNAPFRRVPVKTRLLQLAVIVALSVLVLNMGYGFAGTWTPLDQFQFVSRAFTGEPAEQPGTVVGNRFHGTWLGRLPVPVPADYLAGIDIERRDFEGPLPPSYLRGQWRHRGWWYYYLYALAVKVPLGTWALVLWGVALTFYGRRPRLVDELTVWLPAAGVLILVSSQTGVNHHARYVLPALPFVAVATGKLGQLLAADHAKAGAVVLALLVGGIAESLSVYPHSLSFFNRLAGGPDRGAEHLVDSNIDWGQDLFFFVAWADRHPTARPLGLAYFNFIDYRYVIRRSYSDVPPDPGTGRLAAEDAARVGPYPGWFGVDVHSLKAGRHRYFERFKPVAKAGYSIFIYHIGPAEANAARRQMGLLPLREVEPTWPPLVGQHKE